MGDAYGVAGPVQPMFCLPPDAYISVGPSVPIQQRALENARDVTPAAIEQKDERCK
jgi:hypothetical protein